ncbi:hypothetical protein CC86DRAFT_402083 [Ophiobolus disseminans]|uniref:Uncharacterized protein n=1 Tax=Ophiobolus disseminans TaxID=1469910 RepID=A0A6A7AFA0_9PLEO|nr:hypothetical protein CC86DRAFT_402083 [Ophiobolus disseminans]
MSSLWIELQSFRAIYSAICALNTIFAIMLILELVGLIKVFGISKDDPKFGFSLIGALLLPFVILSVSGVWRIMWEHRKRNAWRTGKRNGRRVRRTHEEALHDEEQGRGHVVGVDNV